MKKIIIVGLLCILSLTVLAVDREGRTDSFTRGDVLASVYELGWGFTSNPYKYVDSTSVRNVINEMTLALSNEYRDACERWDTIATTAATHRYALNTDCIEPTVIFVKDGGTVGDGDAMQRILLNEWGYNASSNDPLPKFWTVFGSGTKTLLIDPVPDDNDTLFVLYRARSNSMSADSTTSNLTIKYYELLVLRTVIYLMETKQGSMVDRIYAHTKDREAVLISLYAEDRINTLKPDMK